jgi:hypothetical protein
MQMDFRLLHRQEFALGSKGHDEYRQHLGGVRIFVCEVLRDLSTAAGVACDERPTRWTSRFDIVTQPAW